MGGIWHVYSTRMFEKKRGKLYLKLTSQGRNPKAQAISWPLHCFHYILSPGNWACEQVKAHFLRASPNPVQFCFGFGRGGQFPSLYCKS